jgi:PKD repeat protein
MQTGLIRRVASLVVAGMLMATAMAPSAAAADGDLTVTAPSGMTTVNEGIDTAFSWTVVDSAPGYPYAIHVDWGDGTATILRDQTASDISLNHTYAASSPTGSQGGTLFTATLSVMDAVGATASASQEVNVIDLAPVMTGPATISVAEGTMPTITLANFTDASVGPWQVLVVSSTGGRMLQTLQKPGPIAVPWDSWWGTATVTVQVGDRGGLYGTKTLQVSTTNSPPVVGAITFVGTNGGLPVVGLGTAAQVAFTDPGLGNQPHPEGYSCTVDYGDGSGVLAGNAGPQPGTTGGVCFGPLHTYTHAGVFTVKANVADVNGGSGGSSLVVSLQNAVPQVGPVVVPGVLLEGQSFAASATFVDDNGSNPDTCIVDFGTDTGWRGLTNGSTCRAPEYAFSDPGTYTVTFTVTDSFGASGSAQATVVVGNVAPTVHDIAISGADTAGGVVTVRANFEDPSANETYVCSVYFGQVLEPGTIGDGDCTAQHSFAHGGLYPVSMTVTDSNGGSGSSSTTVSIADVAPVTVNVVMSNYNPDEWNLDPSVSSAVSATATFTDTNSGAEPYSCSVDYGDGAVVPGTISGLTCTGPAHQYTVTGTYTVTVTVTDSHGATGTATTGVSYNNRAPWIGGLGLVGDVRFGSAPHAVAAIVDPGQAFETYTCTIDYGDGSAILPGTWVPTGWSDDLPRCVFPDHVYPAVGTYTLTARVTDSGGANGSTQWMETIIPAIPVIQSVSAPSSVPEGSTASASAVFLPTALNETYSCTVDYGDGTGPLAGAITGSTCQGPNHSFGLPNGMLITIVVTSAGGVSSSADAVLSVTNVAPTVAAKSVPGTAVAGTAYTASFTFADPGASLGEPETCVIDYGDGGGGGPFGVITGNVCQGPPHFYATKGTYQLVATVTDAYGGAGSYSQTVTAYNALPVVGAVAAPDSVAGGSAVTASADFTTTGRVETYACKVDYGDGTGSQAGVVTGTTCKGPGHTYKKLGTFTIVVTVKGSVSGTGSASRTIGITPPIISVGAVSVTGSTVEGSSVTAKASFTPTGLTETYRCTVDYGDGLGTPAGIVSGSTCIGPKHNLGRSGSLEAIVAIYGSAGTYGSSSRTISVANVLPIFGKVTIPSTVKLGTPLSVTGTFTDPGASETIQVSFLWGDGTSSSVLLAPGVRVFSGSHTYTKAGDLWVNVVLAEVDLVYHDSEVAVYDPGRTLSGSGSYVSRVGFCLLTAKCNVASTATLTVSAKYAAGATKPTVCLSLSAKEFTFKVTTADWFIAGDGTAVMQGAGTVNGKSGYRYVTTLVDGQPDSMFLDIVDSYGNTVYETGLEPLATGSITIK